MKNNDDDFSMIVFKKSNRHSTSKLDVPQKKDQTLIFDL